MRARSPEDSRLAPKRRQIEPPDLGYYEIQPQGRTRISFRVFRVVRGYIPSAEASPAVAARLDVLAGEDLRK